MQTTEKWLPVVGYEDHYEVSDKGNVRNALQRRGTVAGKPVRSAVRTTGYPYLNLCRDGKPKKHDVHRLVAAAFIGPCPPHHCVNHKDGDKQNNRLENLEYITWSQNCQHAVNNGLSPVVGERNHRAQLTNEKVREIRRLIAAGLPKNVIAAQFGVKPTVIYNLKRNWLHVAD